MALAEWRCPSHAAGGPAVPWWPFMAWGGQKDPIPSPSGSVGTPRGDPRQSQAPLQSRSSLSPRSALQRCSQPQVQEADWDRGVSKSGHHAQLQAWGSRKQLQERPAEGRRCSLIPPARDGKDRNGDPAGRALATPLISASMLICPARPGPALPCSSLSQTPPRCCGSSGNEQTPASGAVEPSPASLPGLKQPEARRGSAPAPAA